MASARPRPPGGRLVPASMAGDVGCKRKSSTRLVAVPQLPSILNACEAAARAGVKVRTFELVLMAVMVRATPSSLYSIFWLTT